MVQASHAYAFHCSFTAAEVSITSGAYPHHINRLLCHSRKVVLGVDLRDTCLLAGLGDVAVPGLLACLALRFDAVRLLQPGQAAGSDASAQVSPFAPIWLLNLLLS